MGWPLRNDEEVPRVRRLVRLPDGRRHGHDRDGGRPRLPRRRALRARPAPGAEDAPEDPPDPRGRRAARVGGEDDPRGRVPVAADAAARARPADVRRRRRARQRARAEGHPLRDRVGAARRRGGVAGAADAASPSAAAARSQRYDDSLQRELRLEGPASGPQHAAGVRAAASGWAARSPAARTPSFGKMPPQGRDARARRRARPDHHRPRRRATRRRTGSSPSTSSRPSSRPATRRATTSRTTSASRRASRATSPQMWARMCPAQVYEVGAEDAGKVEVQVTPSNCVQCGAITAKGGRLTPPEGGSGPSTRRLRGFTHALRRRLA